MSFQNSGSRIALFAAGVFGALFLPPYVPLAVITILALRYPAWEAIVLGLFIDLVWLPSSIFSSFPLFTLLSLLLVWGLTPLRREFLPR